MKNRSTSSQEQHIPAPFSGLETTTGRQAEQLPAAWLRKLCRKAGADDVGFVHIDQPGIAEQKHDIQQLFPEAKTVVSLVGRLCRENTRSLSSTVAYMEMHHVSSQIDRAARNIVMALEAQGMRAILGGGAGFPMDIDCYPDKMWIVSHKPLAVAAGLGQLGRHRNVIHPQFGSFIILGSVILDTVVSEYGSPLESKLCLECGLCEDVCPVGAIGQDGYFNFSACFTYNYRELTGGFLDWLEKLTKSKNFRDYRRSFSDTESLALWQSLAFGANYKSSGCMAVCPAGSEVCGPYLENSPKFVENVVTPLRDKKEIIYVIPGSDAEQHVAENFPRKMIQRVPWGARPRSIQGFLDGLQLLFQPNQAIGVSALFHFTFRGKEPCQATVSIREKCLRVETGHIGKADIHIKADSATWLGFVAKDVNMVWALLSGKIRITGKIFLLLDFKKCFPA